jgi:hypothetical protein
MGCNKNPPRPDSVDYIFIFFLIAMIEVVPHGAVPFVFVSLFFSTAG